jgi:hypothetical protein
MEYQGGKGKGKVSKRKLIKGPILHAGRDSVIGNRVV